MNAAFEHYTALKEKYKDAILLFRTGEVYEAFGEDANILCEVTGATLKKDDKDVKIKCSASLPFHSLDTVLQKLVKQGYKVGICEALEEPKKAETVSKSSNTDHYK